MMVINMIFMFILFFLILIVFTALRSVYLAPISVVELDSACVYSIKAIKPTKKFFHSLALGRSASFVKLGNGYFAYYVNDDSSNIVLCYNDITFNSSVYIFKMSRFGRYRSIDLSDRCLLDLLSKFKGV